MRLKDEDVSVVLAGPVQRHLPAAVASVRKHLPGAEVVVSTWRGSVPDDLDADVVVECEDPGTVAPRPPHQWSAQNTNRMLRSAREGVARATRSHVLKMRSDAVLDGTGFLDWWDVPFPRVAGFRVLQDRVLTVNVATRPGRRTPTLLHHPSDCVHFGTVDDVSFLWSAPEVDESVNVNPSRVGVPGNPNGIQRHNEHCMWLGALEQDGWVVDYPHSGYTAPGAAESSCLGIVNNFLVLETWQFGVRLPKLQPQVRQSSTSSYVWLDDWRHDLRRVGAMAS